LIIRIFKDDTSTAEALYWVKVGA